VQNARLAPQQQRRVSETEDLSDQPQPTHGTQTSPPALDRSQQQVIPAKKLCKKVITYTSAPEKQSPSSLQKVRLEFKF
jgi:hypothetical protein